jgi:hypothetical protein
VPLGVTTPTCAEGSARPRASDLCRQRARQRSDIALADPWKDESGHGRWRGGGYYGEPRYERRAFKEEYRRGGCKIERKWDDDEYKEEIKCKHRVRPAYGYRY